MSTSPARFLFKNDAVLIAGDAPPISTFLETHPGAYTTTRTHNNGEKLLFYERHLARLSNSLRILLNSDPRLVFGTEFAGSFSVPWRMDWDAFVRRRVKAAVRNAVPVALKERRCGEELAVSALVEGNGEGWEGVINEDMIERELDVYVHIGMYVPPVFGMSGARLAVVRGRRDFAEAKYSDWARLRKPLETLRPPSATELLLSDDGDRILEGTITNFFVVRYKRTKSKWLLKPSLLQFHEGKDGGPVFNVWSIGMSLFTKPFCYCNGKGSCQVKERNSLDGDSLQSYELQTAPVNDGILPGVIRQLVIEICLSKGIAVQQVSPCWSERDSWEEAFITSSLRLVHHVVTIQAPSWSSTESRSLEEVSWEEKQFKRAAPGIVTALIQREIMEKAGLEGFPLPYLNR